MIPISLNLLLFDDADDHARRIRHALRNLNRDMSFTRVSNVFKFPETIAARKFDAVICSDSVPGFDVVRVAEILTKVDPDVPFFVVSPGGGEIAVVAAMRAGATDYFRSNDLERLANSVGAGIRRAECRRTDRMAATFAEFRKQVLEMVLAGENLKRIIDHLVGWVGTFSGPRSRCAALLEGGGCGHHRMALSTPPSAPALDVEGEDREKWISTFKMTGDRVVDDIRTHSNWPGDRFCSTNPDLRSCWVFGGGKEDADGGWIVVFHQDIRKPTWAEARWMSLAAELIPFAIEKSKTAEVLQESQRLLRIACEAAHVGGWAVELPEGRILWSDELCAIHGVPPGTEPDMNSALGFYQAESKRTIEESFEMCRKEGTAFDVEAQLVTAQGKEIWVRSIGEAVRDEDGTIIRVQGALQEISAKKSVELGAEQVVADRRQTERVTRANELRYLKQRNALISLTRRARASECDLADTLREITATTAATLDAAVVGIWCVTADRSAIECVVQFQQSDRSHSSGQVLSACDYPQYFQSLEGMEMMVADERQVDSSTREILAKFLNPRGIQAILDVPVTAGNCVSHVLCCHHAGAGRIWMPGEKTFALAIANLVSLALESDERKSAEQEVLCSHQRFQAVASATNDTIWDWDLATNVLWWNDGHSGLYGWDCDYPNSTLQNWLEQIHPEDRSRVEESIFSAVRQNETHWSEEYRFVRKNGTVSNVLDRGRVIFDDQGSPTRMVGGMMDLTSSKQAEVQLGHYHRALRLLTSCNEMLIRAKDEKSLLSAACRLAVEIGGYRMAWTGYAMDDGLRRVIPMAHAGAELGYLKEVEISWAEDHSTGIGPVGQAIRGGVTIVFEDVIGNPAFNYWLAPATRRGYRSVICLPLRGETGVFGVLCLYGGEPHPAAADEILLLEEMANDLAFGITTIREREFRQRTQEVVVKVAQAVSSGIGAEFFELLTLNMVEAMNAYGGIIGRYDSVSNSISTIAYVLNGKLQENVSYSLEGTPCEQTMSGDICVFAHGLQQQFPTDHLLADLGIEAYAGIPLSRKPGDVAGIMSVFFAKPLHEIQLVASTLRIFAARAASEMGRRQADTRIRELASLLDKARDAIIVRDLNHRITFWNKSAERIYGWSAEEAIGRSVLELVYQEHNGFEEAQKQVLAYDEWQGELTQVNHAGEELTIDSRWTLVRDEQGLPECVLVLDIDISEHRKLEQQFLRAQRIESIGTLAGGIAHDLNNILAPISMSVEMLKMRVGDSRSNELLDTIASSARRGADMVGQVLSFARGVDGRRTEIHPRQLIREIENILRDTLLRNVELVVRAERKLWTVQGDPTQLHQVLLNLCLNARDAIHDEGRITIVARNVEIDARFAELNVEAREGPYVRLQVEDTGEGIPPEIMDKIFDPFFTTKSVGAGTGLGLSTSQAIIRRHGGFIQAASWPGKGTRFKIYLPARTAGIARSAEPPEIEVAGGDGELILIVDDEDSIRRITQQTLEAYGYRTLAARDGKEAIEIYLRRRGEIDVVFTDMMMPGMDGSATIERLRDIDQEVKIIATSGISANRELAKRGTASFLPKPYSAEALLACLAGVLRVPIKDR